MTIDRFPRLAYFGAWALAAFYYSWMHLLDTPLRELLVFNVAHFGLWAALGLVARPLMRRHPLRLHWRPWVLHLALGALLAQVDITLGHWIYFQLSGVPGPASWRDIAVLAFQSCFHLALLTYFGMLAVVQGFDAHERARRKALEAAEHNAARVQAQLDALKSQLQPHFLFNTLHGATSLMHYDVATAERMLNRLGDLLRISLQETGNDVVSLRRELDFLEAYVEIEKIRFEQRLQVTWAIPQHLHSAAIPPFILQPLVENAIKHGVAPRADGGSIVIRAYAERDALLLEVEDDAPPTLSAKPGFGIGLRNTRERLATLYGAGQHVQLLRAGMGTIARIRLPMSADLEMA